jgi:hypothetical protein
MDDRSARLRAFTQSQVYRDLNALLSETVQALAQEALNADTEEDAARLINEARIARKFAFGFMQAVENTAQREE